MAKRMLIDATHSEETRVAVIDGNRLVEFDYESKVRKQLKGSIFLAKVTRVEPSLQAAFVNFGGNRHGFLPFAEIHPDYFRIPIADREALIAEQKAMLERLAAEEEAAIAAEEAALAAMEQAKAATNSPFAVSDDTVNDLQNSDDIIINESGGSVETVDQEFIEPVLLNEGQEFSSDDDDEDEDEDEDEDNDDSDDDEDVSEQQEHHQHGDQCDHHHEHDQPPLDDDSDQSEQNDDGSESENGDELQQPSAVWIYRGVTSYDESTGKFEAAEDGEIKHFTAETAAKLKALCEAYADIVRIRTDVQTAEDGTETTIVWLAYKADNQAMLEQEGDGRRGRGRYGRRYRGRGRGRNGRDREQGEQQTLDQNESEDAVQAGDTPAPREANNNNNGRGGGKGRRDGRRDGRGGNRGRQPFRSRRVEMLGGDTADGDQPFRFNLRRNYKIQEVIKRGQIMLIQVQKEERGNKGAAVTSYLSLPGRFSVLMPNSPRGGGVSRKIASFAERKRMREILSELNVPEGMSVILRTAGTSREKDEIKRDLDYLMRMWDKTRELTLESSAPSMIYEESSLVKRAVRDIHTSDIEEILVAGEQAYTESKNFMDMLMPTHVDRVKHYDDEKIPLFHRYQVENQIAEIGEPVVQLRSGGYLVINPTEALVSVDVNSGRATKERHIEETALKTNLEAADEVARQLRLRDLGGLVVIDFIDMEDYRNNAKVERRLREALSSDRARIQVGRISSFGLLELSRQRLNPSLTEAQFEKCPHCLGVGNIRSVDSASILALRALEEEGIRSRAGQVYLSVPNAIALYILNNKRDRLMDIERRYGFRVFVRADDSLAPNGFNLEAVKAEIESEVQDSDDDHDNGETNAGHSQQQPHRQNRDISTEDRPERETRSNNNRRGGRGRNDRNDRGGRAAQDDQSPQSQDHQTNDVVEPQQSSKVSSSKPAAQQAQAPSSGFRAKRFSSRKTTDAGTQTASTVPQTANDSEPQQPSPASTNSTSEDSEGSRKKGWWNRLID